MPQFPSRIKDAYPNDEISEKTLLCAFLNDPGYVLQLVSSLGIEADWFYGSERRTVFSGLLEMAKAKLPIDLMTATTWFEERETLDNAKGILAEIQIFCPTVSHVDFHAMVLKRKAAQRFGMGEAERAYKEIHGALELQEVFDICTKAFEKTKKACEEHGKKDYQNEAIMEFLEETEKATKPQEKKAVISTTIRGLDRKVMGLMPGELTTISGVDSSGKSLLANQILCDCIFEKNLPAAYFTMEMPIKQCVRRMTSYMGKISLRNLREGRMTQREINSYMPTLSRIQQSPNLHLYDFKSCRMTPEAIEAEARRLKRNGGISLGVIDHLLKVNIMGHKKKDFRYDQELGFFATLLKQLAVELDMHWIIICPVNKDGRIRDTGNLDYDADNMINLKTDDQKILEGIEVQKWREASRYDLFPATLKGEFCRVEEIENSP